MEETLIVEKEIKYLYRNEHDKGVLLEKLERNTNDQKI